jgi:hypothetical protein
LLPTPAFVVLELQRRGAYEQKYRRGTYRENCSAAVRTSCRRIRRLSIVINDHG